MPFHDPGSQAFISQPQHGLVFVFLEDAFSVICVPNGGPLN